MLEIIGGIVVVILDLYAIIRTLGSGASNGEKAVWVIAILLLPVVGFIAWLLIGPAGPRYSRA